MLGAGQEQPSDLICIFRLLPGGKPYRQQIRLVVVTGEVAAVIELLQFHPVIIDHAIRGNPSFKMIEDQVQSELAAIQPLELLDSAAPTLHRHVVLPPNGVQVGEVCDDRGLLAAKGQIDEILYI